MPDSQKHPPIPRYYTLPLLYIEPLCALNGAYMLISSPNAFLSAVSPNHSSSSILPINAAAQSSSTPNITTTTTVLHNDINNNNNNNPTRILADMLAIMYLIFAFNLAVVLRAARNDSRLWRIMCSGMLLSDLLHIAITFREFSAFESGLGLLDPRRWRVDDWLNVGILVGMTGVRVGVVLGIGIGREGGGGARGARRKSRGRKMGC